VSVTRFIGMDIHKHFMVAVGVDKEQNQIFGPERVTWGQFDEWIEKKLSPADSIAIEMTTNTWEVYDALSPHVYSVAVVHPPAVSMIVKAQVKTDKKAALTLAQLLAAGLLVSIWVPDPFTRDMRALVAQRRKMSILGAQAKNRLHSALHRHHIIPPSSYELFRPYLRSWWSEQNFPPLEKLRVQSDLETLTFANKQKQILEECLAKETVEDARIPLLVQLPGIGLTSAITLLSAIGTIARFPEARFLVGYAGLGVRVHDSGESRTTGRITKSGRRDLRCTMVDAANHAVQHHPFWKKELERLEPRLGRSKAVVAVARKMLIAVWHILTKEIVDRRADPRSVACSLFAHAYRVKVRNLPDGLSAKAWTRLQMDKLGIGAEIQQIPWGTKQVKLPPSKLVAGESM
jgi:transposase